MAESILARMAVELSANTAAFNKAIGQSDKLLSNFEKSVSGTASLIKGALGGISVGLLGKEIIDVTSEFQKFSAVLTNTLGSSSAANIALANITEFAKTTPFAVDELTASFVKLANQGFQPTSDELRKLGDLASSTGKGFDQLTEAIIDAQTGEFERLKEFGIRASKQGDQVKFTFKGVETQTKFTAAAIREYILSLGDAEGVSGAMSAISQTLGGQISNLGDSWTQFLKTIGDGNKGVLAGAVTVLSKILSKATDIIKTNRQVQEELQASAQASVVDELKEMVKVSGDVETSADQLIAKLLLQRRALSEQAHQYSVNNDEGLEAIENLNRQAIVINAQITAVEDYTKAKVKEADAIKAANAAQAASLGIIAQIEKDIKKLEQDKKNAFSVDAISKFNAKIDDLRESLDVLNASHPLTKFAQELKGFVANGQNQLPELELKIKKPDFSTDGLFPTDVQVQPPDFSAIQYAFAAIKKGFEETGVLSDQTLSQMAQQIIDTGKVTIDAVDASILKRQQELEIQQRQIALASEYGSTLGRIVGEAIAGQEDFADTMKRVTKELLATFLARAVGAAIASSFSSSGNPVVGAALAAGATALITGLFSRLGEGGGSKGGSGGSLAVSRPAVSRVDNQGIGEREIVFNSESFVYGNDIAISYQKTQYKNDRLG